MNFNEWLTKQGITKVDFCKQANLNYDLLNKYLGGRSSPTLEKVVAFSKAVLKYDNKVNPIDFFPHRTDDYKEIKITNY